MAAVRRRPLTGTSTTICSDERLLLLPDNEEDIGESHKGVEEEEGGQMDSATSGGSGESRQSVRIATGVLGTISQRYESLDYEVNFNSLMLDEIRKQSSKFAMVKVSFLSLFLVLVLRAFQVRYGTLETP